MAFGGKKEAWDLTPTICPDGTSSIPFERLHHNVPGGNKTNRTTTHP